MNKLNIQRVNVKNTILTQNTIYIGRANKTYNLPASPLANPYVICKDGQREEVVQKYRVWLHEQVKEGLSGKKNSAWEELKALKKQAKTNGFLRLACWCKEDEKCHGDIVINCLNWMNDNNLGD
jgi:hypothetical protein